MIYEIAESLMPTVDNVLFGASMAMDSFNDGRDRADLLAGQLLDVVRSSWYREEFGGFVVEEESQQEFVKALELKQVSMQVSCV